MVNPLYDTWFRQVRQLWRAERVTFQRNLTWLLVGLFLGRSVQLQRIASHIPGHAQLPSTCRRLSRALDHPHLRVRPAYAPIARALLQAQAQPLGEIRLILDSTQVGSGHRLVLVSLAYRQRAVPLT